MITTNEELTREEECVKNVILSARHIQEFLWSEDRERTSLFDFERMLYKRLTKISEIDRSGKHWKVELRKRLLQLAAISINLIYRLDNGFNKWN
jgi:hypothetical protein